MTFKSLCPALTAASASKAADDWIQIERIYYSIKGRTAAECALSSSQSSSSSTHR